MKQGSLRPRQSTLAFSIDKALHREDHRRRRTEASTQTHTHTHTDPDTHTLTDTHLTVSTVNPHYHEVMYISVTRKEMF